MRTPPLFWFPAVLGPGGGGYDQLKRQSSPKL